MIFKRLQALNLHQWIPSLSTTCYAFHECRFQKPKITQWRWVKWVGANMTCFTAVQAENGYLVRWCLLRWRLSYPRCPRGRAQHNQWALKLWSPELVFSKASLLIVMPLIWVNTSILKGRHGSWRMSIPACWMILVMSTNQLKRYLKKPSSVDLGPTEMGSSLFFGELFILPIAGLVMLKLAEIKQSRLGWSLRLAQVSFWRDYLHSSSIFALCHWTAGHLDSQCHIGIGGLFFPTSR